MILLIPITAFLCSWIWMDILRMPERYKFARHKPLNCTMCFAMWSALILYFCPQYITEILFVTTTAAALGFYAESK